MLRKTLKHLYSNRLNDWTTFLSLRKVMTRWSGRRITLYADCIFVSCRTQFVRPFFYIFFTNKCTLKLNTTLIILYTVKPCCSTILKKDYSHRFLYYNSKASDCTKFYPKKYFFWGNGFYTLNSIVCDQWGRNCQSFTSFTQWGGVFLHCIL